MKIKILNIKKLIKNFRSGFSFIELILMISLIMILGLSSSVFYARFFTQNAVSNTVDQLIGDFRKAQLHAMMGKQNSNWGVDYRSNTITLYKGNSYNTKDAAFDETFTVSAGVSVSSTGSTDINFSRITGVPNSAPTFTVTDNRGNTKTLIINNQGMVTRQ